MTTKLFDKAGGYRKLHSFTYATMIHLTTIEFCKKFIPWQEDTLGKTSGQMIGAARSGRQNIIEGSERSATSNETEIKLIDVARASFAELLGDYEIYLAERGEIPWSKTAPDNQQILAIRLPVFQHTDDTLHDYWVYFHQVKPLFSKWLDSGNDITIANAMVVMILRCMAMLNRQTQKLGEDFTNSGGFKERMHQVSTEARNTKSIDQDAPPCPICGKQMRKCFPRNDSEKTRPFWGCSDFPNCKGIRNWTDQSSS